MSSIQLTLFIAILSVISFVTDAYDPDPLQDFCVAVNDTDAAVFVNGHVCKDPKTVTADDFSYSGLNKPGNITSPVGTKINLVFVDELPGLNTLGISMVQGTVYAGFISSNPANPNDENKLYAKILHPGDVFVFPKGLIHFQYNLGETNAVAYASLSSQNPGVVTIGKAIFGSDPLVLPDLLTNSFQLDGKATMLEASLLDRDEQEEEASKFSHVLTFECLRKSDGNSFSI
ncbi:hypothetical protein DH2020_015780 [Rehmannia glutinosa]|uniref:Germin-like protein n=1 Tax=Rehmannia glutinosa TaxID=99300 RepID=A0ABR0WTL1_REHGL